VAQDAEQGRELRVDPGHDPIGDLVTPAAGGDGRSERTGRAVGRVEQLLPEQPGPVGVRCDLMKRVANPPSRTARTAAPSARRSVVACCNRSGQRAVELTDMTSGSGSKMILPTASERAPHRVTTTADAVPEGEHARVRRV